MSQFGIDVDQNLQPLPLASVDLVEHRAPYSLASAIDLYASYCAPVHVDLRIKS